MDVGGSVQHMRAATELKPEPEPEVALRALNAEATKLRKRHDEITAECITLRQKLHQMVERTSGFTKSADLSAGANEDAAEVAELEAELADVEAEIDVANHDHSTYGLMIERIRSEEKTYRRDLNEIDFQSSAKQADAKKLYLMLKDATDVRNAAEAELFRQDKTLSLELAAQAEKLRAKREKLQGRQQAAAEHAARTAEKLRALEAERLDALSRNEHLTSVGSLDDERDRIAKLQLIFDSIAEVCLGRLMTLDDA